MGSARRTLQGTIRDADGSFAILHGFQPDELMGRSMAGMSEPSPAGSRGAAGNNLWESRQRLHGMFLSPSHIRIVFQPIVDLRSEQPVGLEALGRMATGELSVPGWLQGAQAAGIGTELEILLVRVALAKLPELPPDLFLSVNISPESLVSTAFSACLAEHDVSRVVFELTEHTEFPEAKTLARQMANVRERGARIALDDVGSGYTSIRHVLALAPEFIKLDQTLVELAEHESRHRAMVRALAAFGTETGSQVVAEGVETPQQLEMLRELGVGLGQGFLWARPEPLAGEAPLPQAREIPELVVAPDTFAPQHRR
jgi:EAL domain-containing protein (putative c-di-GMP-specific phosphodiesterase class I)